MDDVFLWQDYYYYWAFISFLSFFFGVRALINLLVINGPGVGQKDYFGSLFFSLRLHLEYAFSIPTHDGVEYYLF